MHCRGAASTRAEEALHRRLLLDLLERHLERYPDDRARVDQVRRFVRARPDCFERSSLDGHVTASAWIVSHDRARFLLTHHRKLDRWLQLGGHADGDPDPARVALREAREESGLEHFQALPPGPEPIDVDVHRIPARPGEPAHLHLDLRYLLVAAPGQQIVPSAESHDLRWFPRERAGVLLGEPGLLRLARRADALLGPVPARPNAPSPGAPDGA